jgi:hypothetical protein
MIAKNFSKVSGANRERAVGFFRSDREHFRNKGIIFYAMRTKVEHPYNYEWLDEDAAYLYLSKFPWAVTPQLLFATKNYIQYVRALKEGHIDADSPEESQGADCGY